ncbi:MAG: hypothetical protein A2Y75_01450 [Candidatus Solincola sediminis]|uniref:Uncharacterized protein n=1 Tax=Candidatus Solincola sediminis TaxID=1797199 RepID=A0A1F2WNG8_9ACTN|nr:MAG: hypothetical protein A2Y75_01450 [Candidatus Solincola sediminis]
MEPQSYAIVLQLTRGSALLWLLGQQTKMSGADLKYLLDVIAHHERNWRAVFDEIGCDTPDKCFAGVDIDNNSAQVISAIRKLREKSKDKPC